MGAYQFFMFLIVVQLFFSISVSMIGYAMPNALMVNESQEFVQEAQRTDLNSAASLVESSMGSQTGVPYIDAATLVFFSGNLAINLIMNFIFAIPEMVGLLVYGLFVFSNVDVVLAFQTKTFITIIASIMYLLSLIYFLLNLRTSGKVI